MFKTLTSAVQSYSVDTVSQSANKLWDSLKFEVWNGENDQWIQCSLDLLRETAASLDRTPSDWSDKNSPVYTFIINALAECRDRIKDKPTTYVRTSGHIFNALASATPLTFYLTSRTVMPIVDTLAQAHSGGPERTYVLEVLNGILGARLSQTDVANVSGTRDTKISPEIEQYKTTGLSTMSTFFSSFKDRLLEIYHEGIVQIINSTRATDDLSHCVPSIKGIELLFRIPSYLSESEKGMVVDELVQIALKADQKEDIIEQSVLALGTISGQEPQLFQMVTLPAILGRLPDRIVGDPGERDTQLATIIGLLESLVRISSTTSVGDARRSNFVSLEEALVKKLVTTLSTSGQQQYQHAILASLSAWFESEAAQQAKSSNASNTTPEGFSPLPFLLSHMAEKRTDDGVDRVKTLDSVDDTLVRFAGEYVMRSLRAKLSSPSPISFWDANNASSISAVWTLFAVVDQPDFTKTQTNAVETAESQRLAVALSTYLLAGIQSEVDTRETKLTL